MDKNGKFFGKISIIDLFAIVAIVGLVAGGIYKFTSSKADVGDNNQAITYILQINSVAAHTLAYYIIEDNLLCFDKKTSPTNSIGVIKKAWSEPFLGIEDTSSGFIDKKEIPGRLTIFLEIETMGHETATAYYAGGTYELKVGSEVHLSTKYSETVGIIKSIQSVK